ncbi:MAG TPA: ATP-binding cassette domain-containing protein, partial [Thermotogota bacterium]|nr:ATP-binding cassette domain-containing protein [Thermotogota bacterium]
MDPVAEKEIPLLEVKGISKEFSGVRVLDRVSFSLSRGEIFGIIGENGAGKSTLIKIISGIYHPTEGSLLFEGKSVTVRDAETAHKMGINLIPQEFNLIPEMTVSENIFLGKELRNRWFLDKRAMIEKTRSLLEHLRSDIAADARIESLSVAQKQMVEFAKALASESKLLILDEPTTVLTRKEIDILFEIMRQAKQSGVAMIYISHKLKEVKEICDKVMVLRDGKLISIESSEHLGVHDMATKMVGRELSQIFPPKAKPQEDTVLQVRNLSVPNCLEGVSFDLKRGEILGFAGLVGAGRTELAETLIGIRKKSAGTILLNGKEVYVKNPTRAFAIARSTAPAQGYAARGPIAPSDDWRCDLPAERAVLGAILHDIAYGVSEAWGIASAIVQASDFYDPRNRIVWEVFEALDERGVPLDAHAIAAELRARNVQNTVPLYSIADLRDEVVGAAWVDVHARLVAERAARRAAVEAAEAFIASATRSAPLGPAIAETLSALESVPLPVAAPPTLAAAVERQAESYEGKRPAVAMVPTAAVSLAAMVLVAAAIASAVVALRPAPARPARRPRP